MGLVVEHKVAELLEHAPLLLIGRPTDKARRVKRVAVLGLPRHTDAGDARHAPIEGGTPPLLVVVLGAPRVDALGLLVGARHPRAHVGVALVLGPEERRQRLDVDVKVPAHHSTSR